MSTRTVVTGATGFLGQKICQDLLNRGHQVVAIGRNEKIGKELSEMGCEFVKADLRDIESLKPAFVNADKVIHSGAFSSPWGDSRDFYNINVLGTKNILDLASENKVKRFVHISTPSVYFDFKDRFKIKETDRLASPSPSEYTRTKLLAELEVKKEMQKTGLEIVILRPRGLFGPGDTAIIPRLLKAHASGRLPIIGDGKNVIDMTYIDNVVLASVLALDSGKDSVGEIFNITNGEPIKLWDFLEDLLKRLGHDFKHKHVSFKVAFYYSWASEVLCKNFFKDKEPLLTRYTASLLAKSQTLDISKARSILGYEPKVTMSEGLDRLVTWYKESQS